MRKILAVIAVTVLSLPACGGGVGSPVAPAPPPTLPAATISVLTVGVENATFTISSTTQVGRLLLKCGATHADLIFIESAGLGATFVRADVYLRGLNGDISNRRVTESTARIPASGRILVTVDRIAECGYVGRDYPFTLVGSFEIRDDRGNVHTLVAESALAER